MKKNYQQPLIEITSIEPFQVIAATLRSIVGKSSDGTTILNYGGAGDGTEEHGGAARANGSLWDEWDEE